MPTASSAACSTRCAGTAPSRRACRPSRSRRTPMPCASSGGSPFPEVLDLRRVGVELPGAQLVERDPRERGVVAPVAVELLVLEVLEVEQRVVRALGRADQLVELDLD